MAAVTSMYQLPRQVKMPNAVQLPECMYQMKALLRFRSEDVALSCYGSTCAGAAQIQGTPTDLASIEIRQETVLQRLQDLKLQLDKLQSTKFSVLSPKTSTTIAIGAAAQSSPLKQSLVGKQAIVLKVMDAVASHLQELRVLQMDSYKEREMNRDGDAADQHRSILCRLKALKSELSKVSELHPRLSPYSKNEGIAEKQRSILRLIRLLKEEVLQIAELHERSDLKTGTVHDLVISANPIRPPFFLVLLRKFLKDAGYPVYCVDHLHSSVHQVDESVRRFFTDQPLGDRSKHSLAFTIQWKDVDTPNLMVNPLRQCLISGEANIARYVSRLFPPTSSYNYEATGTFTSIAETDSFLDEMAAEVGSTNNKEQQAALRQLNARLGRKPWLAGNECGIADLLIWSTLKQGGFIPGVLANIDKWFKKVDALATLERSSIVPSF